MSDTEFRWRILLLDTKRSNPNHYLCIALRDALREHPNVDMVIAIGYGDAISRAIAENCNLFIAFDGEELHRDVCARLAAICGRSLLWVTEDPYEIGINLSNALLFDLVFSNDSASVASYGAKGAHLPLAASPLFHKLDVRADADCRYDLFFAGTAWPNRVSFLNGIIDSLAGIKLKLALPHNEHLPHPNLSLAPSSYSWRLPNNQFARLANRSRIVLSLHRVFSAASDGAPMAATPGPRLFEVALAGGFQLVDLSLAETRAYFIEGREFVGFNTEREALEQLRHYLAHPGERIDIARAAQTKAMVKHTYAHRVDVMLAAAEKLVPNRYDWAPILRRKKPRVLNVTHNIVGMPPYGGIEVYQDTMARRLADSVEAFFYVPDRTFDGAVCRLFVRDETGYREVETIRFSGPSTQDALTCPERERAFSALLARHGFDVVHFQHFIGHVPSLPYIARAMGVPAVMSLHDYYAVCSQFNLIGHDGWFCGAETRSEAECDICLRHIRHALAGSQACRRAFFGRMLQHVDVLQANTKEVADRYRAIFPALKTHPRFEVQGVPSDGIARRAAPPTTDRPFRVALLGNFTHNKGGIMLLDVFDTLRDEPIVFEVFGKVEDLLANRLEGMQFPNVIWHGGYSPQALSSLRLDGIALSLHSSIWPETYCLALSEAWQAGLVPLVADIGALGLRVEEGVTGFIYPHDRPGALVDRLRELMAAPDRVAEVRARIHPGLWTSADEHGQWLGGLYAELGSRGMAFKNVPRELQRDHLELTLSDCGVVLNYPLWRRHAPPPPPTSMPAVDEAPVSLHLRALRFLRRNGVKATGRRVVQELRRRLHAY